jgi:hypothetical protein
MLKHLGKIAKSAGRKLAIAFIRHELAILRFSIEHPWLGIYAEFSLVIIWFFIPAMLIIIPSFIVFGFEQATMTLSIPAAVAVAVVFVWMFDWYIATFGLIFGRRRMAEAKLEKLTKRLSRLQADPL